MLGGSGSDLRFMRLALQLAKRGRGQSGSNPSVGCVIVKNGRIIARSVTAAGGRPHAETLAVKQAGNECEGATLFVTLEPCAHDGETPPCALNIISSKITRVVCPLTDPDPRVSGRGFALLKSANITVDAIPSVKTCAEEIIQGFTSRIKRGRPYVTVKLGMSLDGKIASPQGKSKWITNNASRARSHLLRVQNDAILVGTNTFRNDNPELSVRGSLTGFSSPLRVFLDRTLEVFPSDIIVANLLKYPSMIIYGNKPNYRHLNIWENENIKLIRIDSTSDGLNLNKIFEALANNGINSLLIEGGGKLVKSLLHEGLIDKLIVHKSGTVIGADGVPSFAALDQTNKDISDYPKLKLQSYTQYDDNLETVWKPI